MTEPECWPKSICYKGTDQECDPEDGHPCPNKEERDA